MRISLFLLCIFLGTSSASAQWALGFRLGEPTGLNGRYLLNAGDNAIDVALGGLGRFYGRGGGYDDWTYARGGGALMVNYVWQRDFVGVENLEWYAGGGGQLSSRRYRYKGSNGTPYQYDEERNRVAIGLTGLVGIEYFFDQTYFSVFVDASPYLELAPAPGWLGLQGGLGGRYSF